MQAPRLFRSVERLRGALLWLTGFAGAFVFMEPSPYEVASLLTIIVFALTGLALRPALMPLIVLLLLYNIGFSLAVVQVIERVEAGHLGAGLVVSLGDRDLLRRDARHQHGRAALAADARHRDGGGASPRSSRSSPISACSGRPRTLFLLYDRARGTFNDPNVLGAFLVLPAMLVLQRVLGDRVADARCAPRSCSR